MKNLIDTLAGTFDRGPVNDWVVPINQPMIWLFQLARSGGTMALRLFDGHPEVHVHPAPITIRWPQSGRPKPAAKIEQKFNLAKFNRVGFQKMASKHAQASVPIYFDERWYRQILRRQRGGTVRERYDAACTARFNAWRNYQNLYGNKRFQLLHSTIWHHTPTARVVERFFSTYPDGYTLFIARCPEDWLASTMKLDDANRPKWLTDIESMLAEYIAGYKLFLVERQKKHASKMLVLEFDQLVLNPKDGLSKLCERLGISYHPCLEITTVNGIPVGANSSHMRGTTFGPDSSVIGRGKEIKPTLEKFPLYNKANQLFEEVRSEALNQKSNTNL